MSHVDSALLNLGQQLEIEDLRLTDGDSVDLVFEDDLVFNLAREDNFARIRITCELGS